MSNLIQENLKMLCVLCGINETDVHFSYIKNDTLISRAYDKLPSAVINLVRESIDRNAKDIYTQNPANRKGFSKNNYYFKYLRKQFYEIIAFTRHDFVLDFLEKFHENLRDNFNEDNIKIIYENPEISFDTAQGGENRGIVKIKINLSFMFPQYNLGGN